MIKYFNRRNTDIVAMLVIILLSVQNYNLKTAEEIDVVERYNQMLLEHSMPDIEVPARGVFDPILEQFLKDCSNWLDDDEMKEVYKNLSTLSEPKIYRQRDKYGSGTLGYVTYKITADSTEVHATDIRFDLSILRDKNLMKWVVYHEYAHAAFMKDHDDCSSRCIMQAEVDFDDIAYLDRIDWLIAVEKLMQNRHDNKITVESLLNGDDTVD